MREVLLGDGGGVRRGQRMEYGDSERRLRRR